MERCTTRDLVTGAGAPTGFDLEEISEAYDKLAAYEDAEESGRLVIFPCAIGDALYEVFNPPINDGKTGPIIRKVEVVGLDHGEYGFNKKINQMAYVFAGTYGYALIELEKIGDTIFYTLEEAEEKLKEVQSKAEYKHEHEMKTKQIWH